MVDFVITSDSTLARTLNGSESGFISRDGGLYVANNDAVQTTAGVNQLSNNGSIWAYNGPYSAIDAVGTVFEMINGRDGTISAEASSSGVINIEVSFHASVVNHGSIHTHNDDAIFFSPTDGGANFFLTNTGDISNAADFGRLVDINLGTGYSYIVNNGTLSGGGRMFDISADVSAFSTSTLANHGTISSQSDIAIFINLGNGSSFTMANTGTISGWQTALRSSRDTAVTLTNSGTVTTHVDSGNVIEFLGGDDVIRNQGQIIGRVLLGAGDDYLRNIADGTTSGEVYAGLGNDDLIGGSAEDVFFGDDGNDVLVGLGGRDSLTGGLGEDTLRGGAEDDFLYGGSNADEIHGGSGEDVINGDSGDDLIYGNSGDDTINGGTAFDTIFGGSGDDDIRGGANTDDISGGSGNDILRGESGSDNIGGGAGEDTLSGSTGNDSMDGGSGDDRMFGGSNNDVLEGTLGNDYLNGGSGDDLLRGGSDNDTLIGGTGQDTLSGGHGADVFVFSVEGDSPHGATRDVITDFTSGEDMIDLSGFAGDLTFIGGSGYSNTAGEVRYNSSVGRLYIDIDGNSSSDFSVDLAGNPALNADDFIF